MLNEWIKSAFLFIAPEETADEDVLPVTVLLRPVPMVALSVMVLNDHLLKGSGLLPSWVTGILSDFSGLIFFPLLLMTLVNILFYFAETRVNIAARLSSPRRAQALFFCAVTGVVFSGVQLHDGMAELYSKSMAALQFWNHASHVEVTQDPYDLLALISLFVAYGCFKRSVRLIPPGRLRYIRNLSMKEKIATTCSFTEEDWAQLGLEDVCGQMAHEQMRVLEKLVKGVIQSDSAVDLNHLLGELRAQRR